MDGELVEGLSAPAALGSPVRAPSAARAVPVGLFAAAVLTVQILALRPAGGAFWGADAWAFLPSAGIWITGLLVAAAAAAVIRREPARSPAGQLPHPALLLAVAALLLWMFRIRHVLLGDGVPLTTFLPTDHAIHPREPLAMALQHVFFDLLHGVFAGAGSTTGVVQDCVAVGSVLAGLGFLALAPRLAAEIVRAFPAVAPEDERTLTLLVAVLLCAQGYLQVFFGYVENYAFPMLVAELYLLGALRFLRGASSIVLPLAAAACAVALSYSALVLGPSVIVLVVMGLRDRARAPRVARDLLLVLAASGAVLAAVQIGLRYPALVRIREMLASGRATSDYLFSSVHLRDFLNEHLLIGPCGLLLFVPVVLAFRWRGTRVPAVPFLLVAGGSAALACALAPDLPLGYARDWDLYTPVGVVLTASAVALLLAGVAAPRLRRDVIVVLAAVSAFHTIGWVALNHSERRSLARFETLPLGGGRTETTVAWWYAMHGDHVQARSWLRQAFLADPSNSRALDLYGRIAFEDRDWRQALRTYLVAVTLRPDKSDFRSQLATAVDAVGGPAVAMGMLDSMLASYPDQGGLWFERAMLLRAQGRVAAADSARSRAVALEPELGAFPDTLPAGAR